jgi:hypothetical protein
MREFRAKRTKAKLEREREPDNETIPSTIVGLFVVRAAQRERQRIKDTMRGMEGQ